jgi:hypothetical protein
LYVECGSDATHLKNLARAFQQLPTQLQETCLEWRVTFNFAMLCTASGNSSTFYGDFTRSTKEGVSPHVEMGRKSLQPSYILAHLTHELCHLFWRTRSQKEQELYRQFLRETCTEDTVEITEYVHEYFESHLKAVGGKSAEAKSWNKASCFNRWVEESFCDTIAAIVDPAYPSYNDHSTVDLATRRLVIIATFGLELPEISVSGKAKN